MCLTCENLVSFHLSIYLFIKSFFLDSEHNTRLSCETPVKIMSCLCEFIHA